MDATWTLQDAKNRFSAVVDAAAKGARRDSYCACWPIPNSG
jgi:hypothetical protein